jgi:hypothetical protein
MFTAVHAPQPLGAHTHGLDDPWLTVADCAVEQQCHPASIRRMIYAGQLRHARVGPARKLIRVRRSWLHAAVEGITTPIEVR